ncbi:E3 ubiquitin-protein ligase rbbp6 [Perkinsus chesapeaki]|uniref:E3 ubiquitin-protein ligase rbbp6 n=1 Tax=Perkinsus chesapeaki TaxID=330153 RepID=A0A7J6MQD4_PERCH|nr:E3 ubiquitin-protein ligase rbbp6 [Perkinsus chesapeaki]
MAQPFRYKKPRRPVVDLEGEDESEMAAIDSLIAGHDVSLVCPDAPGTTDESGRKILRPVIKYGERPEPRRRVGEDASSSGQQQQTKAVPPPHYRCHRCGEPGHYIYDCPTNEDPTYTSKQKVKSARGVPRQFLRVVSREEAQDMTEDVYILPNGDYAVMKQVSDEERKKIVGESEKERMTRVFSDADWRVQQLLLSCGICHQLPTEAEVTPCCGNLYCRKCVVEHLAKTHSCVDGTLWPNKCPGCNQTLKLSSLIPDRRIREQLHFIAYGKKLPQKRPQSAAAHNSRRQHKRLSGSKLLRKSSKKSRIELSVKIGGPSSAAAAAAGGWSRTDKEKVVVTKVLSISGQAVHLKADHAVRGRSLTDPNHCPECQCIEDYISNPAMITTPLCCSLMAQSKSSQRCL